MIAPCQRERGSRGDDRWRAQKDHSGYRLRYIMRNSKLRIAGAAPTAFGSERRRRPQEHLTYSLYQAPLALEPKHQRRVQPVRRADSTVVRIIASIGRFRRDGRGSTTLKVALLLPAVLMMGAVAFDLTQVHASRNRLQTIADSAALATVHDLSSATESSIAVERARTHVDSRLSEWSRAPAVEAAYEALYIDGRQAVEIRLHGRRPSFLADLLPPGGWTFDARSVATAAASGPPAERSPDQSG